MLLSVLKDSETGQRGFLLTGEVAYLEPFNTARAQLDQHLAQLATASAPFPDEIEHLSRIRTLVAEKMAVNAHTISLRQSGESEAAVAIVRSGTGKQLMDSLRAEIAAMRGLGDARLAKLQAQAGAVHWLWPICTLAISSLLFGILIRESLRKRYLAAAHLANRERFTSAFGLTGGMLRDLDGRITFWGAGMEALYGFTTDMAVGQFSHSLLATRFPAPLPAIERMLLASGDWHGELTHRCADGSLKTVMSHWVLHRDQITGKQSVVEMNFDVGGVREADPHRQLALDAARLGTWVWNVGGAGDMVWDARCLDLIDPPAGTVPSFQVWREMVCPEDLPAAEMIIYQLVDPEDATDTGEWEFRVNRSDGRMAWMATTSVAQFMPDPASMAGRSIVRLVGTVRDVSMVKSDALERERAASLLRTIIETNSGPIYAKDRTGKYLVANAGALALIGKPWCDVHGRTDSEVLDDQEQAAAVTANDQRIMATGECEELEERVGGSNGHARFWLSTKTPMRAANNAVIGLVGVSVEITDRKRDEARRELMIHELNHRVKNTLATVQAVVTETLQGAEPAMRAALDGRLVALANVHDVLTRETWQSAELGEVVAGALSPFGGSDTTRFQVRGPHILLQPRAAVALAMGLHELATNASKYGALCAKGGRVAFTWEVVAPGPASLHLTWTESGGPPVVPPTRRSFGSNMIEGPLAWDLAGSAKIHFDPAGVRCVIDAPMDEVVAKPGELDLPLVSASRQ
jgi:PAS domain S-box-containing protein